LAAGLRLDPLGAAYSAPQNPLAGFQRRFVAGEGRRKKGREEKGREGGKTEGSEGGEVKEGLGGRGKGPRMFRDASQRLAPALSMWHQVQVQYQR